MTKYTDEQIIEAIKKAGGKKHPGIVYAWELSMYKQVIDALPEPDDGWQECSTGDLLMTDRFKVEGPGWTFEGEVKQLGATIVCYDPRNGKPIYTNTFDADDDLALYRIPGTQHPDPAEHPVILVTEYDVAGNIMECEPTPFFAHDGVYKNDIYAHRPDGVLSWCPAKVVADHA